ncbi:MAG: hypothetical protein AAF656_02040, partial [Planctomycetota bacterium]
NVILGHLIPAGTAYKDFTNMTIVHNTDDLDEVEYAEDRGGVDTLVEPRIPAEQPAEPVA